VLVISHDCDLANDNLSTEPNVEIIVGRIVSKSEGNYLFGKAPRTLHIPAKRDGQPVTIEVVATEKRCVRKEAITGVLPDGAYAISAKELSILSYWLGIRYNRAAFPDAFTDRMSETKLERKLAALLSSNKVVSAVYFDVDSGRELEHSDGSPHELSIVLAFPPGDNPLDAMDTADATAKDVEALFVSTCFDDKTEKWTHFKINKVLARSEDDLTVTEAMAFRQWRLEHLSLREDDERPKPFSMSG